MFTHNWPVSLLGKHVGAESLEFDSRAGQIGHSVANCSPSLRRFFEAKLPRRDAAEIGSATLYLLRRDTAGIMKI